MRHTASLRDEQKAHYRGKQETFENVGPIRHCEPPHAAVLHCHSPGVVTVARRLRYRCPQKRRRQRQRVTGDRYGPIDWAPYDWTQFADVTTRQLLTAQVAHFGTGVEHELER